MGYHKHRTSSYKISVTNRWRSESDTLLHSWSWDVHLQRAVPRMARILSQVMMETVKYRGECFISKRWRITWVTLQLWELSVSGLPAESVGRGLCHDRYILSERRGSIVYCCIRIFIQWGRRRVISDGVVVLTVDITVYGLVYIYATAWLYIGRHLRWM